MKVKSCWLIEGGIVYRPHWIGGCCTSTAIAPFFYEGEAMEGIKNGYVPPLHEIVEKRKDLFTKANDPQSGIPCLKCSYLKEKEMKDVSFDKLSYIDIQHYTSCNNRCTYCYYTRENLFVPPQYDLFSHLDVFTKAGKVTKDCIVLFNGGEPALLKNFSQYIDYFCHYGIKVELYTNGTIFRQDIYDSIALGNIIRTNISVDAGTADTYKRVHGTDSYDKVIENIARYSEAAEKSGTLIQAKYIFTEENSNAENIRGFVHAMLAIRPQVVLLTMNFEHLTIVPNPTDANQHHHSYDTEVEGYASMYMLFKKYGWEVGHLVHYITIIDEGRKLCDRIMNRINELEQSGNAAPHIGLRNFRKNTLVNGIKEMAVHKVNRLFPCETIRRRLLEKTFHAFQRVTGRRWI